MTMIASTSTSTSRATPSPPRTPGRVRSDDSGNFGAAFRPPPATSATRPLAVPRPIHRAITAAVPPTEVVSVEPESEPETEKEYETELEHEMRPQMASDAPVCVHEQEQFAVPDA